MELSKCKKCKQVNKYWNAIGNTKNSYFKRKEVLIVLFIGAVPIVGQLVLVGVLVGSYFQARRKDIKESLLKEFDEDYIRKLVEKDKHKTKRKRK